MSEHDYISTTLWQSALAARSGDDSHSEQRERLRTSYLKLRQEASTLLQENARSMPNFTVHDITHVDALWETADIVCGDDVTLNPAEAYVLGCTFVLHDAAMGEAAYGTGVPAALGDERWRDLLSVAYYHQEGCWPDQNQLASPPAEIADACRAAAIRESHAEQARRLVDQAWRSSAGNEIYLIDDVRLREAYGPLIGSLAASHWWPVDRLADEFRRKLNSWPWQSRDWTIDPLKLACILRLADATQIDGRRAPTLLFALRNPQGSSREHWRFQTYAGRPDLNGDRVTYTSQRPFLPEDASSWWLALDYLRSIDQELKAVDALLHDLGRTRLAARAVAGVDSPERFAEHFRVQGWRPIDATIKVSDVPALVRGLGGEQLYGNQPEVGLRELIQNAQDAVLARRALQPDFPDGRIEIRLTETDGSWHLEVRDNGVGMDEETIIHGLLDFGNSGWSSPSLRNSLPGLASGGFKPSGRFGIGFFSVFLLGDHVELITRRYDASVQDARRLTFNGPSDRPLLTRMPTQGWVPEGTTVRVTLKKNPNDVQGLLYPTEDDRLRQLIQRLVLENAVSIHAWEPASPTGDTAVPFSLATALPEQVFDRLYPAYLDNWNIGEEKQRLEMRDEFAARATELLDDSGTRIGLATLWNGLQYRENYRYRGTVTINGFLADKSIDFLGYLAGRPSRASRDRADLVATQEHVRQWIRAQEQQLRNMDQFDEALQLQLAGTLYRAFGSLPDDVAFSLTSQGAMRPCDISEWAAQREQIFLAAGIPLAWNTRPVGVYHYASWQRIQLPDDWILVCENYPGLPLSEVFSYAENRDTAYDSARNDTALTWQKRWWRISGDLDGYFLRSLCEAWSCTPESLLEPIERRNWSDTLPLDDEGLSPVWGYLLQRPARG
ncbi:HD domain-containing protein [Streptomyces phaeochromogenes]|uniref:HD domain-containing protein n=1 Tax=Streptomyces phaeochromogenes TaxID=1923 RepID=UPI002E10D3C8|nr:ATP-binding protein [Streptomyces phaeochromogenes]